MKNVLFGLLCVVLAAGCSDEVKEPDLGPGNHIVMTKDERTVKVVVVNRQKQKIEVVGTIVGNGLPTDLSSPLGNASLFSVKTEHCGELKFSNGTGGRIQCSSCGNIAISQNYPKCVLAGNITAPGDHWTVHQ